MDIDAILLSLKLAFWTMALILPFGIWAAHKLLNLNRSRPWVEAALALPLVLPPTVLGYYFLVSFGHTSIFGVPLVFSFTGILLASLIANIPFAIQPIQRAFEAINPEIREAAQVSGLSNWQIFRLIELPLSWRGITGAAALTFAHTLGEFGVVLMVGGAIPGETKQPLLQFMTGFRALIPLVPAPLLSCSWVYPSYVLLSPMEYWGVSQICTEA